MADERSPERMSDDDDTSMRDEGAMEMAHEELKVTFEYQVQRLREIDGKAIEILKANLLLIGIVVTGGSILIQTDLDLAAFINVFTVVGGLLLLASTGLAAVTYTASNLRGGFDADAIEAAIAADTAASGERGPNRAFQAQVLRSYGRWIEYNARVTAINDMLATATVLFVFVAFVYIIAGIVVVALDLTALSAAIAFFVMSAAAFGFMWVTYHMDHLPDDRPRSDSFDGIRLSKGATRRQGWIALREMLVGQSSESDRREK